MTPSGSGSWITTATFSRALSTKSSAAFDVSDPELTTITWAWGNQLHLMSGALVLDRTTGFVPPPPAPVAVTVHPLSSLTASLLHLL